MMLILEKLSVKAELALDTNRQYKTRTPQRPNLQCTCNLNINKAGFVRFYLTYLVYHDLGMSINYLYFLHRRLGLN